MNHDVDFENLVRLSIREVNRKRLEAIPSDEEINSLYPESKVLKDNMIFMYRKNNRKYNFIEFSRRASTLIASILIMISLSCFPLLTAKAVRESVVTTVLDWKDKFTRIFMESDIQIDVLPEIILNYIPYGYEIVNEDSINSSSVLSATYKNNKNNYIRILINLKSNHSIYSVDNEFSNYYTLIIGDSTGTWVYTNDENKLIITKNNLFINISGQISIEEIVQIYKNISIV